VELRSVNLDEARALVSSVPHWHHAFEIFPGLIAHGTYQPAFLLEKTRLPADLTGMRVLDIGSCDGFFALQLARRGARVVAIDYRSKRAHGYHVMEQLNLVEIEYHQMNIYELAEKPLGEFDIVLFLGVLYHLPDMIRALQMIRARCRGTLFVGTHSENDFCRSVAAARHYRGNTLAKDHTNFWAPNGLCVLDMPYDTGFDVAREEALGATPVRRGEGGIGRRTAAREDAGWLRADRLNHPMTEPPNAALPIPPFEMRQLVGPTDEVAFDNPSRAPILNVPEVRFDAVLDFGCGCGRLARQMLQQHPRPRRYVGFDLHAGTIRWCSGNLAPCAPGFSFMHHDVQNISFNPDPGKPLVRPMPAESGTFSLLIALSVFTHTIQAHAEYYLREAARVLRPDGEMAASFFLFEKRFFPMMQDFQNALYINIDDPWNAVIFHCQWLEASLDALGLGVVRGQPPDVRGFQWVLHIRRRSAGEPVIPIPEDRAPFGRVHRPVRSTTLRRSATRSRPCRPGRLRDRCARSSGC
jgi:tRNA (mo5U34)-methyltransferase